METLITTGITGGILVFVMVLIGLIFTKLYKKATKETAFIRTGLGGEKVILDGGAIVLPVVHDQILVNMQTLRLQVIRIEKDSLITSDRMRIDITADFYVRVAPNAEAVGRAAQTLGRKTLRPDDLKVLIEGKFVDVLRAVAAEMKMEELHESRSSFVEKVKATVAEDLLKNGLELETVALTNLDQTKEMFFDENSVFDTEGLTVLKRKTEDRRRERNDIEKDAQIAIEEKNLETRKQSLEYQLEQENAEAKQSSQVVREREERRKEEESATIVAEKEIEEARIQKELFIKERQIEKDKSLEISEQNKQIAIYEKSQEKSRSASEANAAKADEVRSQEAIVTAKEIETAEREKRLLIIDAEKDAESAAISIKVNAATEKAASQDKADAIKIEAQGTADAIIIKAEAEEKRYEVDAKGQADLNNAENVLSDEIIQMRIQEALIKTLPSIIAESVKPMEKIDSIRIAEMSGLNGSGGGAMNADGVVVNGGGSGSLSNEIVDAALKYKTHAPVLASLTDSLGLDLNSLEGMTAPLEKMVPARTPKVQPAKAAKVAKKAQEKSLSDKQKAYLKKDPENSAS